MDQFIIKFTLIATFALFAVVLLRSSTSARSQALRSIGLIFFLFAAILAVVFPQLVNDLALLVGVGRGTDLLLYAFIVVFLGQTLAIRRRNSAQNKQITLLTRTIALMSPQKHSS